MTTHNSHSYFPRLIYVFLFSAAIGYVEAMVVVYLRALYYPEGFIFPLKLIPENMILLEMIREACTIVILFSISALSARRFWERFGYFLIYFGLWDIFYYIWLKAAINWPSSLFDWDILFLIPLPWIGPVIAPVLIALLMVIIGISLTHVFHQGREFKPVAVTWLLAVAATLILLFSFMKDLDAGLRQAVPEQYRYWMLITGLILYIAAYVLSYRKIKQLSNQ